MPSTAILKHLLGSADSQRQIAFLQIHGTYPSFGPLVGQVPKVEGNQHVGSGERGIGDVGCVFLEVLRNDTAVHVGPGQPHHFLLVRHKSANPIGER
ncbi:hypothetical protein JXD38_02180 [candidate division WOR-3 bacterium]|nr:hypothetical protein [candidate division WOR-3 bacterium]